MSDSNERGKRAGRREANLRLLNERIAESHDGVDPDGTFDLMIVCECARPDCDEMIALPSDHFEVLDGTVDRFAVVAGHVLSEVERVIEDHGEWQVVRKHGPAAEAAAQVLR